MATFFMFGNYSTESLNGICYNRTKECMRCIKDLGGEIKTMHALLGQYDLVFVAELPGVQEAMKAAVALGRITGISFCTSPALPIEKFDEMLS